MAPQKASRGTKSLMVMALLCSHRLFPRKERAGRETGKARESPSEQEQNSKMGRSLLLKSE